jgi:5,10-methylenetetrahydromethanopterin reductase
LREYQWTEERALPTAPRGLQREKRSSSKGRRGMLSFGIEFLAAEPAWKLAELVKFSEDCSLEYAWISDHYNNRDAYCLLTYIATKTNTIKLGTGVTNPYTRSAAQLASAIATVNEVSGGRAVFGIGPGDRVTFDAINIEWRKPLAHVRETVNAVQALTAGEKLTCKGEAVNLKGAKLNFKTPTIPVYLGAQGPNMLRLSGEIAQGALVNASHPEYFRYAVKLIREGAEKNHRDFNSFDVAAYTSFSISEDRNAAVKAAKPTVAFITAGSPDGIFEKYDISTEKVQRIREAFKKGLKEAVKHVTPEMIEAFSICGTPAECTERINELINAGVTQIIPGSPIGPDRIKAIKLIGEKIAPQYRD